MLLRNVEFDMLLPEVVECSMIEEIAQRDVKISALLTSVVQCTIWTSEGVIP